MHQIKRSILLIALLPLLKAQEEQTFSREINISNKEYENMDILATTEETITTTVFPPLRCLNCKFCFPNEGKTRKNKGKKMCPIKLGELNGCISIYYSYSSSAGGPDGYMVRSCISDLDEDGQEYCRKNSNLCEKCYDKDCNTVDITKNGLITNGKAQIMASIFVTSTSTVWLLMIM
ncbi:LOW QUALITY PROTEIN: uncharacterized protein LOC121530546 [Drosophila eugracilis]|uniref:LOW QUALITY PROTEIN: uncharacterized protein LOC121530546 n=1 Tax=Drosophila eugracilis TaxID=29029 RepID=UPI001BDA8747|nr:LOW QUALITY PROTEIN: uncharacterized protein LOC121530546 [Drosophila eugracilis]